MLWKPEFDDIYVMSGKTGYLDESGWNLVVSLRPYLYDKEREVLLVLFGTDSRRESFADAKQLAEWVWRSHVWK
jgi:D-alanyl-D-alanine carboxypeptidase